MGKTSRAILAGVGAGLTTFGEGLAAKYQADEAQKVIDARLEKTDAFKDRELTLREDESALRQKAMERQALFDEAKLRHGKLISGLRDAGENKTLIGEAYSENLPDDRQWHYNDGATKDKGVWAVFNIGYRVTDPGTGEYKIDPTTGLPMERSSPINKGQKVFNTREEYTAWQSNVITPTYGLSLLAQQKNADIRYDEAVKVQEFTSKTPEGKAALAKTKAQTDESIARAEKLRTEATGTGKVGPLAKIKEQGMNQFANNLTKELGVSVSATTAKKIASISDDNEVRGAFHKAVTNALNPDNPITRSDFIESGISQGLPREFMERFYSNAERSYEERGEETDALSDGWFKEMFDSVLGIFTSN